MVHKVGVACVECAYLYRRAREWAWCKGEEGVLKNGTKRKRAETPRRRLINNSPELLLLVASSGWLAPTRPCRRPL